MTEVSVETCFFKLKSFAVFFKFLTCLLISRSFGNVIHDIAAKYDHLNIADLRKLEKISIKSLKAELDLTFLRNCQSFNVVPRFLRFNLPKPVDMTPLPSGSSF